MDRIYLDNAATSWPKPEGVYAACDDYLRHCGAPAGRSAYREASDAARIVQRARSAAARLLNASAAERVVFAFNGTDALHLALQGVLRPGDHVVTTAAEHNSVLRPIRAMERSGLIRVSRVPGDGQGYIASEAIEAACAQGARLVVLNHASNVTGAVHDIDAAAQIAHRHGALLLVDAAQSLGHLPIDVQQTPVDLLAASGHKGPLGPLGTGLLYIRPGVERELASVRPGGTGSQSQHDEQPDTLPDKYESGNHNLPGLAGLAAGIEWLLAAGVEKLHEREMALTERLLAGLGESPRVQIFGPPGVTHRVGVVSVRLQGVDSQEASAMLDASYRVQTRAGLHCAPRMHAALGTLATGGTLRLSLGPFNTAEHIDAASRAIVELALA